MDELGGRRAEGQEELSVQRFVRTVVEAAHDVRDAEVGVVDHARKVIRRAAVLAQERDAVEALAERGARLAVATLPLALPNGPFVPLEAQPAQVFHQLFLTARNVPRRV